jgi:hypothetical protein
MSYAQFMQPQGRTQPSRFMLWNRRLHRWIGIVFLITVAAKFLTMAFGKPPMWVVYAPLPPLFAMMLTGLVMLVNHYRPGVRPS